MVTMSWLFNTDYELKLFSSNPQIKESSRLNQEFEYLMHYLDYSPIATLKQYSKEAIEKIEFLSNKKFELDSNIKNAKNFWGELKDIELERKLNSKITTTQFLIENGLSHPSTLILNEIDEKFLSKNFVIKLAGGFSGKEVYSGDKFKFKNGPIIVELKLDRLFDFSVLNENGVNYIYQNFIDKHFQYRGTIINRSTVLNPEMFLIDFNISEDEAKKYNNFLKQIKKNWGENSIYSIDSFIYQNDLLRKVYFMSEINYRKTFGWLTLKLADKFLKDFQWVGLFLSKLKNLDKNSEFKIISLSPNENQFQVYLCGSNHLTETNKFIGYFQGPDTF
jgi:hypothetical protein